MTTLRSEPKSNLGKFLQDYRTDRPDEWTMDNFTHLAEQMQARVGYLEVALSYSIEILKAISDDPEVINVHKVHFDQLDIEQLTKVLKG